MTTPTATAVAPRLEIRRASKTFGSRSVLRDVHLTIGPGEIHGVVGQNGSGKSTMAKIVSGYHAPDAGTEMLVDGHQMHLPARLHDLHAAGVSIVYQDLGLLPHRNVTANVRVGAVTGSTLVRRIDWRRQAEAATVTLQRLGFSASVSTAIDDLTPADKARVAIARALQERQPGRGLLVFDESTRALPDVALVEFYSVVRSLAAEGTSVLIIGHRLSEILEHCDRVTVLRDGECVGSGIPTADLDDAKLASVMLGRELSQLTFPAWTVPDRVAAKVSGLEGAGLASPFDLEVAPGEIVGLAGLPGSGYEAVPYLLGLARPPVAGTLTVGKETTDLATVSLSSMPRRGVVLIPEDRLNEGLCAHQSVRDNVALPWLDRHGRWWSTGRRWQQAQAQAVIDGLNVVPRDASLLVGRLSGGNQQKVLLGKWLSGRPKLLLLHEPTQAVDIKARHDILEAIHKVARQGTPVILASSEAPDLALMCDRILVFRDGEVSHQVTGPCGPGEILDSIYRRELRLDEPTEDR
jgi:ribose transport system ATP-binding protein